MVVATTLLFVLLLHLCFVVVAVAAVDAHDDAHRRRHSHRHRRRVAELFANENDDAIVKVFVGYKSKEGRQRIEDKIRLSQVAPVAVAPIVGPVATSAQQPTEQPTIIIDYEHDFDVVDAVSVESLTKRQLEELENDDDIEYIEKDSPVEPLQSLISDSDIYNVTIIDKNNNNNNNNKNNNNKNAELTPYGILLSGALLGIPTGTGSGKCNDPNSMKVAIVDSGIDGFHSDLPCNGEDDERCRGKSFGRSSYSRKQPWYVDTLGHGTHIAGTIAAIGGNQLGVRGMIHDGKICLLLAKVFGNGATPSTSTILDAVRWAVDEGAMVINLSLGGDDYSKTADKFYEEIYEEEGRIIVAAAGNDGEKDKKYPASYDSVLSVSAIDKNEELARFSSYTKRVDFTAPGEHILSTVPEDGARSSSTISILKIFDKDDSNFAILQLEASLLEFSEISEGQSGTLVECPDQGEDECPGEGGHICVIERGDITFEKKALNCEDSGGLAAIIYNDDDGPFSGTLTDDTKVKIPVVGISKEAGEDIIENYLGETVNLLFLFGYGYADGTSMAAPHVTGAIAAAWRPCQDQCTNEEVVECFKDTAKDLGKKGKDKRFGHGLIQTSSAYKCLQNECDCYQVRRIRHRK